MGIIVITGSAGLVGSAAARFYADQGANVIGIDNDARASYFGAEASTLATRHALERDLPRYRHADVDVRDRAAVTHLYRKYGDAIELTIHAAGQPSHDWSGAHPVDDFEVNASATVALLDAHLHYAGGPFVFLSTNKVYGDRVNRLGLEPRGSRLDLPVTDMWYRGVSEAFPIDATRHSPMGVSKLAADLMVQEYGRYFGVATCCLRGGTLTGPNSRGARLHGFLAYLVACCKNGVPYVIEGHDGLQVRDVLHAEDVVFAIEAFRQSPSAGFVANLGGGRANSVSVIEAIRLAERATGKMLATSHGPARIGDHRWWVTNTSRLESMLGWGVTWNLERIVGELADSL